MLLAKCDAFVERTWPGAMGNIVLLMEWRWKLAHESVHVRAPGDLAEVLLPHYELGASSLQAWATEICKLLVTTIKEMDRTAVRALQNSSMIVGGNCAILNW